MYEKIEPFGREPPEWSAFRSEDYGYTRITIVNRTHLSIDQVSDDQVFIDSLNSDILF